MKVHNRGLVVLALVLALALLLPTAAFAQQIPAFPAKYSGTVLEAGDPAPDGAEVFAVIIDYESARVAVSDGAYANLKVAPPKTYVGRAVEFWVDVDGAGPVSPVQATPSVTVTFAEWVGFPGEPSGTVNLTYTPPHQLVSIEVTPAPASIKAPATQQFVATGKYYDEVDEDVTTTATWASSDETVATIDANGLATPVGAGTAEITATVGAIASPAASLTVATVASIAVTPASATIDAGDTQQFTATATYNDGSTGDVTTAVTWTSSDTSVATMAANGRATAKATGAANITATLDAVTSAPATLTVKGLASLAVSPATISMEAGERESLTAEGTYSDGTTEDLTTEVTWKSSDTSVASVTTAGVVAAIKGGIAEITATLDTVTGSATVTVVKVESIAVSPTSATVKIGATQQFKAVATYNDKSTKDVSTEATWASSDTATATVSASGLATAKAAGSANISATFEGVKGSATLTVPAPVATKVVVTPATAEVNVDETKQFTAKADYDDGRTGVDVTATATWTSSDSTVATVSAGLATGVKGGDVTITAQVDAATDSATLTVLAPGIGWWVWLIIAIVIVVVVAWVIVLMRRRRAAAS